MPYDQSVIDALVANPAESLNVERKRWIDPSATAGVEKIVKAAFALRNRDGGFIVIGFDDVTLAPDTANTPPDIRGTFHVDVIQALISRYASELFEIEVAFSSRDGIEYPVIVVPPGVRVPVAAKRDLMESGRTAIRRGTLYFRTLSANGTPSSAEAQPEDWRTIVEICFENREADIGRFLRRHLTGADAQSLAATLAQLGFITDTKPSPTLRDRAERLLKDGEERYLAAIATRNLAQREQRLVNAGAWRVAMVVDPSHNDALPDNRFKSIIGSSNPKYTGWPVWLDSSLSSNHLNRQIVKDGALQALVIFFSGFDGSAHFDFLRFDPKGEFFQRRILQDDAVERITPGTVLDPVLVVLRVAEAIAVGIAFAKALDWQPESTTLGFAFQWTGLENRRLSRWGNLEEFDTLGGGTAHDNVITTFVELPLDTPLSAIAPFVQQATKELFVIFDSYVMPSTVIEENVRRLIERRLS